MLNYAICSPGGLMAEVSQLDTKSVKGVLMDDRNQIHK